jgi:uncharacterized protein YbjT (DUF2867 family)
MRIFLAGASGVIGVRLIPLPVRDGHQIAGMTRSPGKAAALRELLLPNGWVPVLAG